MKENKSKSIRYVLAAHKSELFALMMSKAQFGQLKEKVNELLDSPELANNEDVNEARQFFRNAQHNYNYYLSILTAYLTGISASK